MSVVVPFPGSRIARTGGRGRAQLPSNGAAHPVRGGGVISWLRAAQCSCCGRPTLSAHAGAHPVCVQCTPPSVA